MIITEYAYDHGIKEELGIKKQVLPVRGCRTIAKKDMIYNNVVCDLRIDPTTHKVTKDSFIVAFGGGLLCNMAGSARLLSSEA